MPMRLCLCLCACACHGMPVLVPVLVPVCLCLYACACIPVPVCLFLPAWQMEKLARAQYQARRDPKDCALLYVALDRKSVLQGLMKLSRDDRDKKLVDFLARDFTVREGRSS